MNTVITFLREVRVELGKVSWPTRRQLIAYTAVVIGLSFAVAIYLGGLDTLYSWALSLVVG